METEYKCICGRIFTKANAFNGHKSHCIIHQQSKGTLEDFVKIDKQRHDKAKETNQQLFKLMKKEKEQLTHEQLLIWIEEKHVCEKCGKVMTEKYGSGRFCCKACANSRTQSEITKQKLSLINKAVDHESRYLANPKYCAECNNIIPYARKKQKCCCDACAKLHRYKALSASSKRVVKEFGGNINQYGVRGHCHYGTYKGFHCDSSYELAYVVYCLEHDITIERNKQGFSYVFNNEEHLYYPDFIVDNTYIEIKNY